MVEFIVLPKTPGQSHVQTRHQFERFPNISMRRSQAPSTVSSKVPCTDVSEQKNASEGRYVVIRDSFMPLLMIPRGPVYEYGGDMGKLGQAFKPPGLFRNNHREKRSRTVGNDENMNPLYAIPHRKRLGCMPVGNLGINGSFNLPTTTVSIPESKPVEELNLLEDLDDSEKNVSYDELVLYNKVTEKIPDGYDPAEVVDTLICPELVGKFLRPHQRDGVKFLFNCVMGLQPNHDPEAPTSFGCILADDMGLGKTIQSIALLYSLLTLSIVKPTFKRKPIVSKAIVVCPTSLVKNWEQEIEKWLKGQVQALAVSESNRKGVIKAIKRFTEPLGISYGESKKADNFAVLVISYDTFRLHHKLFENPSNCELLICDEAHRLKNCDSKISLALSTLSCKRRILLSGTPIQNDLEEFFSLVSFSNPGILGDISRFRRKYANPICMGRDPDADAHDQLRAQTLSVELSKVVDKFILKRVNTINIKYLPPKITQIVCIKLSSLQKKLYIKILSNRSIQVEGTKCTSMALNSINLLKQISNSVKIVKTSKNTYANLMEPAKPDPFGLQEFLDQFSEEEIEAEHSSKFMLVLSMLEEIRKQNLKQKIVIVSNYTKTLLLLADMLKKNNFSYVKLDGSVNIKRRNEMVQELNAKHSTLSAFLLSSKAGGCGLNLIGANRLILSTQAARVWREGQPDTTYVYRFLSTCSIEEKMFQRQISKNGLQSVVEYSDTSKKSDTFAGRDLKDIFSLETITSESPSDTHDKLNCKVCKTEQVGYPKDEDILNWAHHPTLDTLRDPLLQACKASSRYVSFVFSQKIDEDAGIEHIEATNIDKGLEENIPTLQIARKISFDALNEETAENSSQPVFADSVEADEDSDNSTESEFSGFIDLT